MAVVHWCARRSGVVREKREGSPTENTADAGMAGSHAQGIRLVADTVRWGKQVGRCWKDNEGHSQFDDHEQTAGVAGHGSVETSPVRGRIRSLVVVHHSLVGHSFGFLFVRVQAF